jgi:PhzF family phenazine biosynthesis protein
MKLRFWQVDAFSAHVFGGNPAGIVPLETWPEASRMQAIAAENNLAETAFFVKTGPGAYDLRWFTPTSEVDLCGHATLASAYVVFRFLDSGLSDVRFNTRSGELKVGRGNANGHVMSLPAAQSEPLTPPDGFASRLARSLNSQPPRELHFSIKGGAGAGALTAVWNSAVEVTALKPGRDLEDVLLEVKAGSLQATAQDDGRPYDFVSRFFAPHFGVQEDPVTGSAHAALVPFWSQRLNKKTLKARQLSTRGGDLICTNDGARVILQGPCALYLTGEIEI